MLWRNQNRLFVNAYRGSTEQQRHHKTAGMSIYYKYKYKHKWRSPIKRFLILHKYYYFPHDNDDKMRFDHPQNLFNINFSIYT